MDLQLRKIAARHAKCYRSYKAYLSGFEDAQPSELFETEGHRIKAGWVTAVEMVQKRLLAADPEKAMVFSRLFQLESGSRCRRNEVIRLSMSALPTFTNGGSPFWMSCCWLPPSWTFCSRFKPKYREALRGG